MQTWLARTTWIGTIGKETQQREKESRINFEIINSKMQRFAEQAIDTLAEYLLPSTTTGVQSESSTKGPLLVNDLLVDPEFDESFCAIYNHLIDYWSKIDDEVADSIKYEFEGMALEFSTPHKLEGTIFGRCVSQEMPADVLDAFKTSILRGRVWQMWRFATRKEEMEMTMFLWAHMAGLNSKTTNFQNIDGCISTWERFEEMAYHYNKCMDMLEITSLGLIRKRTPTLQQLEEQRRRWFVWAETAVERSPKCFWGEGEHDDQLALPSDAEVTNEI